MPFFPSSLLYSRNHPRDINYMSIFPLNVYQVKCKAYFTMAQPV